MEEYSILSGRDTPGFERVHDSDEPGGDWPFREVFGSQKWLANQTRAGHFRCSESSGEALPCTEMWALADSIMQLEIPESASGFGIKILRSSGANVVIFADASDTEKTIGRRSIS